MTTPTIHNPVDLVCIDSDNAHDLALSVTKQTGAPTRQSGNVVTLPGDQPGFLFNVLDFALAQGYATDAYCSAAISQMESGLR